MTEHDHETIVTMVTHLVSEFVRKYVSESASAEIVRGAERFALVAAGGELATRFGITGWIKGTAEGSCAKCFEAWRRERGTDGKWDEQGVVQVIRAELMAHGDSRFQYFKSGCSASDSTYHIHDRLGFTTTRDNSEREYLLQREALSEICKPYPWEFAKEALRKSNLLILEDAENLTVRRSPPGMPKSTRFYAISSRIFTDEQSGFDFGDSVTPDNEKSSLEPVNPSPHKVIN